MVKQIINKKKYVFIPYNKRYQSMFLNEKKKLEKVLPKKIKIEHVGSTSIPGLGGKGIIDITIFTSKIDMKKNMEKIESVGFEYKPHANDNKNKFMQKIIKNNGKEIRTHIHLTLQRKFWNSFFVFRDYLKRNKKARDEYANVKKEAVKYAKGSGKKYRDYKDKFIKSLMKKALKEQKNPIKTNQ